VVGRTDSHRLSPGQRDVLAIAVMAVAYFLSGRLGLLLAVPPGYATAVWPASGIALAGVLVYGWRTCPGVWLGSFAVNVGTSLDTSGFGALVHSIALPAVIAIGATLQAALGAWLVRRFVGYSNILTQEFDVIRILVLGGPVACLTGASIGVGSLWTIGAIPADVVLFNWWTWWVGDSIGVLVFAPIALVWTVRPYKFWLNRQLSVTLPLLFMFVLVVIAFVLSSSREQSRLRTEFEDTCNQVTRHMRTDLERYSIALSATTGFLSERPSDRPEAFERFTQRLMARIPEIYAVSWNTWVADANRDVFEATMRARGLRDFQITELGQDGNRVPAARRPYYIPITDILYSDKAQASIGFDIASNAARRRTFELASTTGAIVATPRIKIVGDPANAPGFLIIQAVRNTATPTIQGYAVLVLRFSGLISNAERSLAESGIQFRLLDLSASEANTLPNNILYGSADEAPLARGSLRYKVPIEMAQRHWQLEYTLPAAYLVAHHTWQVWLVLAVGLLIVAFLGLLLLVIVGRTSKVEQEVTLRTTELRDSETRFRNLLESAPDAMIIVKKDGKIDLVNQQAEKLFGYSREELLGRAIEILIPGRFHDVHVGHRSNYFSNPRPRAMGEGLELHGRRKSGAEFPIEISLSPLHIGLERTVTATIRDVSERKQAESYIRHLAHHDALTHLPNRALLQDRLEAAMARADRQGTQVALLMLDLDHFKRVNASLGHQVGDELLKTIVERLLACVRKSDTVARMGGDEFVILLPDIKNHETIEKVAATVQEQIAKSVAIGGRELVVTSSIGLTVYPQDGKDVITLLKNADTAMYRAKESGRNNYQWFEPAMLLAVDERLDLENSLRHAIERNEFSLHYQPMVSISNRQLVGMEALLRWQHPVRGAVAPDSFIFLAEESGLIIAIGEWVLRTACREGRQLQNRLGLPLDVAVNLSPRQFGQQNLREVIESALADSGLAPNHLTLEITETALATNPEAAAATLAGIRSLGVSIAVDDFGTGYSSLSYLTRYPIDKIKIDRSFVRDLGVDLNDTAIINAILAMAHSLGIKVVAEGVETHAQLMYLIEHACDEAQGYYFGKALPADQFKIPAKLSAPL
jgi:diguanylate cyclase (GGDEF)-like protein/PAS domain S-box-containing protein